RLQADDELARLLEPIDPAQARELAFEREALLVGNQRGNGASRRQCQPAGRFSQTEQLSRRAVDLLDRSIWVGRQVGEGRALVQGLIALLAGLGDRARDRRLRPPLQLVAGPGQLL